jgi:hypothetical protein
MLTIAYVEWKGEDAHEALPCLARLLSGLAHGVSGHFLLVNFTDEAVEWLPLPLSPEGLLMLRDLAHEDQVRELQKETSPLMRSIRKRIAIRRPIDLSTPEHDFSYEVSLRDREGKPQARLDLLWSPEEDDSDFLLQREDVPLDLEALEEHLVRHAALLVALARADECACVSTKRRVWTLLPQQSEWNEE